MAAEVKTVQRAQLVAAMEAAFAEGATSGDARVPEQREPKGAHRPTTSLGRLRPRSRLSKGLAAGGLTVASPPAPSAGSPRPAPTPSPVTPSTASSAAWRTSGSP